LRQADFSLQITRHPAFERGFEEILAAGGGDRKEAILQSAALLGGVVLARAVRDARLSDEILECVRQRVR
jgi:TetR/AcrR family transcriptional repressor of nem operon